VERQLLSCYLRFRGRRPRIAEVLSLVWPQLLALLALAALLIGLAVLRLRLGPLAPWEYLMFGFAAGFTASGVFLMTGLIVQSWRRRWPFIQRILNWPVIEQLAEENGVDLPAAASDAGDQ
jgi:hypothetical protein